MSEREELIEIIRSTFENESDFGSCDIAADLADDLLPFLADRDARIREDALAEERNRLMESAREWATRSGVPLIEVPALVVLLIDDRPMTDDDIKRGQELWAQRVRAVIDTPAQADEQ